MKSRVLAIALLAGLALVGCKEKKAAPPADVAPPTTPVAIVGTPTEQAQKTVERYNQLLAEGYRNLNMTPLQEVASEKQAEKAYIHMSALGEGKSKMISQLKKITFLKTEFPTPQKCLVSTDELWDFAYHNIETGAKAGEQKNFLYHVNYTLEQKDGRWQITDIFASSDEPEKAAQPRQIKVEEKAPGQGTSGSGALPPGHGAVPPGASLPPGHAPVPAGATAPPGHPGSAGKAP